MCKSKEYIKLCTCGGEIPKGSYWNIFAIT